MKVQKHFFLVAVLLALLSITAYFKYDMDNGWNWLIPFALAVLAIICIALSGRSKNKSPEINRASTITCPLCGHQEKEIMPEHACAYFYECKGCKTRLKPKEGDCCVYCSYGSKNALLFKLVNLVAKKSLWVQ